MNILIGDIETDAIYMPSNIWMVGVLSYDTNEFTPYYGDKVVDGLIRLAEADLVIGHNFRKYDAKNIERMTNNLVKFDQNKIIDTLEMSRKFCSIPKHSLKEWGKMFGYYKGDYTDFSRFDPAMIPYCERDCEITKMVYDILLDIQRDRNE